MEWNLILPVLLLAGAASAHAPRRPVHTFSIVARDPATGEMGVAVQSHYFSVGPVVPWAEAGVGAVATQSLVLIDYGPNGLALMRGGKTAKEALDALVKADSARDGRQVAMVDARANVAAWTGPKCIPDAGYHVGDQYSVQANLMANDKVWPAMAKAYETTKGDLAERMLAALEAGQSVGGDIRGRQSAAILIVKAKASDKPWSDKVMDLRVEDHPEPIRELRRLVRLRRAYDFEDAGDNAISAKQPDEALRMYTKAMEMAPDVVELQFWAAVSVYTNGDETKGLALFRQVFAKEARWVALVPRLAKAGLFPDDAKKIAAVQAQAAKGAKW